MRNWFKTTISFLAAFVIAGAFSSSVFGVASFARQTGLDCTSCHASAPGFPALNSFGAAFKAGGYVMGNEDNMIGDGERLSIPAALNLAVVTKVRAKYQSDGTADPVFKTNTPDEFAVFIAGRVGKNVGFITEYGAGEPLSFKIPVVFDIGPAKLGVVIWWSDAFGPAWVFETATTGAVRNLRAAEDRATMSAFSALNWGNVPGQGNDNAGLGLYVWHPMGFVAYTPFVSPGLGGSNDPGGAHYIRAAVTPNLGGLEALVGFAYYTGTTSCASCAWDTDYNMWGVDAQVIGNVGIPVSLFVSYANSTWGINGNASDGDSALSIYAEVGIIENVFNFGAGFRNATFSKETVALGQAKFANGSYSQAFDITKPTATASGNDLLVVVKYSMLTNLRLSVDFTYNLEEGAYMVLPMLFGSF